jgi:hypothetical protein
VLQNPALWSFGLGLAFRNFPLPVLAEQGLRAFAPTSLALSLVLIGMRLSQLSSWRNLPPACLSLGIKMLLVPLILAAGLPLVGVTGSPQLVLALQMAMPPAFATLVLAEVYNLDRDLTVTALAVGSAGLLLKDAGVAVAVWHIEDWGIGDWAWGSRASGIGFSLTPNPSPLIPKPQPLNQKVQPG